MSISADIFNGFSAKLLAFASAYAPILTVGFIGVDFNPPNAGPWLLVSSGMSSATDLGLGVDANFTEKGRFNVMCYDREGNGINAIMDIAEAVRDAFPKLTPLGTAFVDNTPSIRGPGRDDKLAAMLVPVQIDWRVVR